MVIGSGVCTDIIEVVEMDVVVTSTCVGTRLVSMTVVGCKIVVEYVDV